MRMSAEALLRMRVGRVCVLRRVYSAPRGVDDSISAACILFRLAEQRGDGDAVLGRAGCVSLPLPLAIFRSIPLSIPLGVSVCTLLPFSLSSAFSLSSTTFALCLGACLLNVVCALCPNAVFVACLGAHLLHVNDRPVSVCVCVCVYVCVCCVCVRVCVSV